jgi:hypothetical protein
MTVLTSSADIVTYLSCFRKHEFGKGAESQLSRHGKPKRCIGLHVGRIELSSAGHGNKGENRNANVVAPSRVHTVNASKHTCCRRSEPVSSLILAVVLPCGRRPSQHQLSPIVLEAARRSRVSFFSEGWHPNGAKQKNAPKDLAEQSLSTRGGIDSTKAVISIDDALVRRPSVALVEEIAKQ